MNDLNHPIALADIKRGLIDTTESLAEAIDLLEHLIAELEPHLPDDPDDIDPPFQVADRP
jgi:hypothetical protein